MSELYRVCVTDGYPIGRPGGKYEAEAIVYTYGGRTVARFIRSGPRRPDGSYRPMSADDLRAFVRAQAEAWIEAHRGS
jgi:hypothetical protein